MPRLTVMVSVRDGHALAAASLRSVLADDAEPFDLIYVDIQSPPGVAKEIAALCASRGGRIVRHDTWIAPSAARKAALKRVRTPYVVFIDNDIMVEPGCFARLVARAEATGAALVGPLYLQGDDGGAASIHMAGGALERSGEALLCEVHELANAALDQAAALTATPVDSLEYHCTLARTAFVTQPGVISDDVRLVHEHIDLALKAKAAGLPVWLEPAARVVFQGLAPRRLGDLAFFRRRWDRGACEQSMAAFAAAWPLADEAVFHEPVRRFLRDQMGRVSLLQEGLAAGDRESAMRRSDLAQSRVELREQAAERGYGAQPLRAIESACDLATLISDGLYRPDGRPFLNHVIGTASALAHFGLKADIVLAGLLHAAYSHRPPWMSTDEVSRYLASGGQSDQIVRDLTGVKALLTAADVGEDVRADQLTLAQAAALCVEAANEADLRLAGEYRACGRPLEFGKGALGLMGAALAYVDLPGLALSAAAPVGESAAGHVLGFGVMHGSFRLNAPARRVEPVWPPQG
jgi:GT2 family glycosyltransferase